MDVEAMKIVPKIVEVSVAFRRFGAKVICA
jgi:hypothetical protein